MRRRLFAVFVALVGAWGVPTIAHAAPARFALVVGNNHPLPGSGYAALQYADDDALRFASFMHKLGAQVQLFTGPDADSAERHAALSATAQPPRRELVMKGLDALQDALQAAEGQTREVYIYFSGHGSVTSSKAFLHLLDGGFTRTDMRSLVLDRLSAERVHVIVDSCHAYFMVNPRGQRVPAEDDGGGLERYPQAGFLLSTSAKKEVQEWSGYEGGVFSYQLLGAMQGAADVNLDGKVTYAEAHAYVVAANSGVQNLTARVQPFVRRPTVGDPVLVTLNESPELARVQIPDDMQGHLHLVDGRGRRLLDANKAAGDALGLYLPRGADVVVWLKDRPYAWGLKDDEQSLQPMLQQGEAPAVASRGAVADEFRQNLFRRPLTQDFVAGLDAAVSFRALGASGLSPPVRAGPAPVAVGLWASGGAGLVAGAVAAGIFAKARSDANPAVLTDENVEEVERARTRAAVSQGVMIGGLAGGAALVVSGLLVHLWRDAPQGLVLAPSFGADRGELTLGAQF